MRVTNNSYTDNLISNFHAIARRQIQLQDQIATGQRIQNASDDPFAAQQVLQLRDDSVANAQYQKNIGVHNEFADVTHGVMRNFQKVLDRAQEIAFTVDEIDSPEDLESYATELDSLIKHAVQIANAQHRGEYVLAGTMSNTKPFTATENPNGSVTSVTFNGSSTTAESEISPGVLVSSRVPGENRGGAGERGLIVDSAAGADIFAHLIALRDQLASGDVDTIRTTTRDQLRADEENVLFHMAQNGALQSRLESSLASAKDEAHALESEISSRADVDLPEAIVRLNQQQTNYQAALQSASSIMNLSLLNFIR
ncbi:MAG TPA: flagellin [Candidatus Kapabacteria bacterium]|nr:flagellin [Candidatus Kapabacteria bacterium]